MVQFYGVSNVTRLVSIENFVSNIDIAYQPTLDHWWKDNPDATSFLPRWKVAGGASGNLYYYDGSYVRLKTAELSYTFKGAFLKKAGMSSFRVFANGNNLYFWSKLPDDREQGSERFGAYPTSKLYNMGLDIRF